MGSLVIYFLICKRKISLPFFVILFGFKQNTVIFVLFPVISAKIFFVTGFKNRKEKLVTEEEITTPQQKTGSEKNVMVRAYNGKIFKLPLIGQIDIFRKIKGEN